MRLRFLSCLLSALAVLAVAPAAKAAIVLQHDGGVALGSTGLFKFIVSAVATENEVITAFNKLSVTGGHHVYDGLVNNPTPFIENASGTLWNPAWTPYDTHVTIPAALRAVGVGIQVTDMNDGTTTGTLGLPNNPIQPTVPARTGFGNLVSPMNNDGVGLDPSLFGQQLSFLQVVTTANTALVSVEINTQAGGEVRINNFEVSAGGTQNEPPTIIPIPELHVMLPDTVSQQLNANDDGNPTPPSLTWSNLVPDAANPGKHPSTPGAANASLSAGGLFDWNPNGWQQGLYNYSATVSDGDLSTSGHAISVYVWVPEPATVSLLGLALVGLVGFTGRRRS